MYHMRLATAPTGCPVAAVMWHACMKLATTVSASCDQVSNALYLTHISCCQSFITRCQSFESSMRVQGCRRAPGARGWARRRSCRRAWWPPAAGWRPRAAPPCARQQIRVTSRCRLSDASTITANMNSCDGERWHTAGQYNDLLQGVASTMRTSAACDTRCSHRLTYYSQLPSQL